MGEWPADILPSGWQEQAPPASLLMPSREPSPGDKGQMSISSQGAGKAVTFTQPSSSYDTAEQAQALHHHPNPGHWVPPTLAVPLPTPITAPPLPPFGMQMAGDCRE